MAQAQALRELNKLENCDAPQSGAKLWAWHTVQPGSAKVQHRRISTSRSNYIGPLLCILCCHQIEPNHATVITPPRVIPGFSWVQKRAFRRARNRASANGGTWYRGKWLTAQQLNAEQMQPSTEHRHKSSDHSTHHPHPGHRPRLRIMSHNVGTLSTDAYDELMNWLQQNADWDVICLQETGWSLDATYTSGRWHVVSSGCKTHKNSGLMVLVSKRLITAEHIRFDNVVPGRIQVVKLEFPQRHIDIINVYQYVWSTQTPAPVLVHNRERVWTKLHQLISAVAQRNTLVMCGDFNCPLSQAKGHTGPGLLASSTPPADQSAFDSVLQTHGLVALNTWGRRSKAHTYEVQGSRAARTQIDYIITRRGSADSAARASQPRQDLHFCSWRGGGRHLVLQASIPVRNYQPRPQPKPAYDREALVAAVQEGGSALQQFRHAAQEGVQRADTPTALNHALVEACQRVFPAKRKAPFIPWQQSGISMTLRSMWHYYRQTQSHAREVQQLANIQGRAIRRTPATERTGGMCKDSSLIQGIFHLWKTECRFRKLHTHFRRSGRGMRKERTLRLLDAAEEAAKHHNQKELYSVIRQLAPKQPRKRVQLRGNANQLLTNSQELRELVTFSKDLFQHDRPPLAQAQLIDRHALTEEQALRTLQPSKSAPRHLAPNAAWKGLAELLAPKLRGWYEEGGSLAFPRLWTDAWIVWLAKPHKPPDKPSNLRPIALQDGGGKAVAHPQFAYLQGRLLETAVLRAVGHCRKARDLLSTASPNIQQRHRGEPTVDYRGSAILSLDLSQAFDRVDRPKLLSSLKTTGMPDNLIQSVTDWHDQIQYHPQVGGQEATVRCGRGLRQGCAMSPTLWVAVTGAILQVLEEATSSEWVRSLVTLFADDVLEKWEFHAESDLDWFLYCIGMTFQILEEFGMTVNPGKSQLLIQLRGKKGGTWLKRRTRRMDDTPVFIAKTPQGRVINLPMVDQIKYLGVILSFGMFERSTVRHRLKCAEANRRRLQHVLQGKHRLSVAHRLRIWQACVMTSMLHGVAVTGITPHELRLLRSCVARHVRAIAACPIHLTRESTTHLFNRLKVQEPHVQIQHRLMNIVQRVQSSDDPMINDPGLAALLGKLEDQLDYAVGHWTVWQTQRNSQDGQEEGVAEDVQAGHTIGQMVSTRAGEATCSFLCPECLLAFPDIPAVKQHHRKAHGRPLDKLAGQVDRDKFGTYMPILSASLRNMAQLN